MNLEHLPLADVLRLMKCEVAHAGQRIGRYYLPRVVVGMVTLKVLAVPTMPRSPRHAFTYRLWISKVTVALGQSGGAPETRQPIFATLVVRIEP